MHAAWLQENPDGRSLVAVVQDGPRAPEFLTKLATSEDEIDASFRSMVADIHPLDFSAHCRRRISASRS